MSKKHIFIGADSAGYDLKGEIIDHLKEEGYEVTDCGTNSSASCHYPVFAGECLCSTEDDTVHHNQRNE